MAKQFTMTTDTGIVVPTAYAKLVYVSLDALAKVATLQFQVFATQSVREQYPALSSLKTFPAYREWHSPRIRLRS